MKFFLDHVLLIGLAIGSGLMLVWPWLMGLFSDSQWVSENEAVLLMNRKNAVCLDVRELEAFKSGHIVGAQHMALHSLQSQLSLLTKFKEQTLIVTCQTGTRAQQAAGLLKQSGFQQVYLLSGGMDAWVKAKLPVEKV